MEKMIDVAPEEKKRNKRRSRPFWSGFILWGLLLYCPPVVANPDTPLVIWLNAHPTVDKQILWEFPPQDAAPSPDWNFGHVKTQTPLSEVPNSLAENMPCDPGVRCIKKPPIVPDLSKRMVRVLGRKNWPVEYWQKVEDNFSYYSQWLKTAWPLYQQYAASNYTLKPAGFDATFNYQIDPDLHPVQDPPPDLQPEAPPDHPELGWLTIVPPSAAFDLYAKLIAFELALAQGGYTTWRLEDYGPGSLALLFDGRMIFQYVKKGPTPNGEALATGYLLTSMVVPAPPLVIFSFLAQNAILRPTRFETAWRLLAWQRPLFIHDFEGEPHPDCGKNHQEVLWGYRGGIPVSVMARGMEMACPLYVKRANGAEGETFWPGVRHFTGSCTTSAYFNQLVLRVVNLPAAHVRVGHSMNSFIVESSVQPPPSTHVGQVDVTPLSTSHVPGVPSTPVEFFPYEDGPNNYRVFTSHADDPYGLHDVLEKDIPSFNLFINDETFHRWFHLVDPNLPEAQRSALITKNELSISRQVADLRIKYLPLSMLYFHCSRDSGVTHEDSYVYSHFFINGYYSVEDLERLHLWENLEAKLVEVGGCSNVPSQSYY